MAMLGLAAPFSISTSMPLLTLARRESSSSDSFFLFTPVAYAVVRYGRAYTGDIGTCSVIILTFFSHWSLPWYKTVNTGLFMSLVTPSIDPRLAAIALAFRALSILVEAAGYPPWKSLRPCSRKPASRCLMMMCRGLTRTFPAGMRYLRPSAQNRNVRPARHPPCVSGSQKDGSLPPLDPVVDIYNAVSIRYAIPVGGENLATYSGAPRLTLADGSEPFDTFKEGQRWWNTRSRARLSGATTSVLPAVAGTGAGVYGRVLTVRRKPCGLFWKVCRQCRLRHWKKPERI